MFKLKFNIHNNISEILGLVLKTTYLFIINPKCGKIIIISEFAGFIANLRTAVLMNYSKFCLKVNFEIMTLRQSSNCVVKCIVYENIIIPALTFKSSAYFCYPRNTLLEINFQLLSSFKLCYGFDRCYLFILCQANNVFIHSFFQRNILGKSYFIE